MTHPLLSGLHEGLLFRHYKGGLYRLITVGRLSEQRDQWMVVYFSMRKETTWIRPLEMFIELVPWSDGVLRPRFCVESPDLPPGTEE